MEKEGSVPIKRAQKKYPKMTTDKTDEDGEEKIRITDQQKIIK